MTDEDFEIVNAGSRVADAAVREHGRQAVAVLGSALREVMIAAVRARHLSATDFDAIVATIRREVPKQIDPLPGERN